MEVSKLKRKLYMHPEFLDENLSSHIKEKLKENYEGECSKRDGFICKILGIFSYRNNHIINNPLIEFNISFKAMVLKPEPGKVLSVKVNMVFHHGIFAELNSLKILIPTSRLKKYKFKNVIESSESYFYYKKNEISVGSNIKAKIVEVRYERGKYSCIGDLYVKN